MRGITRVVKNTKVCDARGPPIPSLSSGGGDEKKSPPVRSIGNNGLADARTVKLNRTKSGRTATRKVRNHKVTFRVRKIE